jgi:hypothetical protein
MTTRYPVSPPLRAVLNIRILSFRRLAFGGEIHLDDHATEFFVVDKAVIVGVVTLEHFVDRLIVHVVIATEFTIGFVQFRRWGVIVLTSQISFQTPRDLGDKVFGGQTGRPTHIAGALAVPEGIVQRQAQLDAIVDHLLLDDLLGRVAGVLFRIYYIL